MRVIWVSFVATLLLTACGSEADEFRRTVRDDMARVPAAPSVTPSPAPTATPDPTPTPVVHDEAHEATPSPSKVVRAAEDAARAAETPPKAASNLDDRVLTLPEKAQLKYPNLGSRLNDLVVRVEKGETPAQETADGVTVRSDGSVAVTVYLSGSVANVVSFLNANGGDPRNVGEGYIEAYVPVTLLADLSEQPGVLRVREIIPAEPTGRRPVGRPLCDEKQEG